MVLETSPIKQMNERLKKLEEQNLEIIRNQRTIMRQLTVLRSVQSNQSNAVTKDEDSDLLNLPSNSAADFEALEEKYKEDPKTETYLVSNMYKQFRENI